ncbi:MAG TPA: phage tail protein [Pyrinomonadaceae bacterium]|jgi:phage tail-like protein
MDANGLKFWMLAEQSQWLIPPDSEVSYDVERKSLRLASRGQSPAWPTNFHDATLRLEHVPQTRDEFGTTARWDRVSGKVMATGALPGEVEIFPQTTLLTDLAIGYDGVLYLALGGEVALQDLRGRWETVALSEKGFTAWRLAAVPSGGVWVLDRGGGGKRPKDKAKLARVEGLPFPNRPYDPYATDVFRPCPENPHEPRLRVLKTKVAESDETIVGLAAGPQGEVLVLSWFTKGGDAQIRLLQQDETFTPAVRLSGVKYPYSIAWVSEDRVAVMFGGDEQPDSQAVKEAAVYKLKRGAAQLEPVGEIYPLRDYEGGPFLHGTSLPPRYPTSTAEASAPLYHLSLPSFASSGQAFSASAFDSGSTQTVWHRLYLEASIPPNCGLRVFLAAGNESQQTIADNDWEEHQFGELFAREQSFGIARGAWVSYPSEIPFHPGLLGCERERNRKGLFTVLIQRPNRRVRTLRGRYLHVRVELLSDGRATPEVAALRAYASRFSYLNRYLPEFYGETEFGPEADAPGLSTPPDFLERFLDNFEGVLTTLEDRISNSYLLTHPRTTTDDALEWLGSWVGVTFEPMFPVARRREFIAQAPQIYRRHGTLSGLKLALDVATGGAVGGGEIVVLEDFRLRRVFATILGADLSDEADPLLPGGVNSGNSYVGDTLFLGDEQRKEFLALFNADLRDATASEKRAIAEFFERLAHRATVLVHQEVEPQDLGLIRRVVELSIPAHVQARVMTATKPFMVGMASLVGVDTYLSKPQPPRPFRIGDGLRGGQSRIGGLLGGSQIGMGDFLLHPPSLDPRLESGSYDQQPLEPQKPVAVIEAHGKIKFNDAFQLDAHKSHASSPGRKIKRYIWTLID